MSYRTALATREELAVVGQLIDDYVRQNLDMAQWWPVARETFQTDYDNDCFQLMVVYNSTDQLAGFAAWVPHYDLHHCARGSLVIDLYVKPASRGRGLAAALISAIATIAVDQGHTFLRGIEGSKDERTSTDF